MNLDNIPDEVVADFVNDQTDYTLDLYRNEARKLSREFLDASYEAELEEAVQYLDTQYREKYEQLVKELRPHSWWYGVWQSFAASFIFFAAGILLLLATGGWARIGQALMQLAQ